MPIDSKSIVVGIGPGSFTLDVVLIVAGVFVMAVTWLMHKINPLT